MNALHESMLPDGGTYVFDSTGKNRIFTGAQMGRRNWLPEHPEKPIRYLLIKLKFHDGDYDKGGAYWGGGSDDHIYWARSVEPVELLTGYDDAVEDHSEVFVRSKNREEAKQDIRDQVPGARFFR